MNIALNRLHDLILVGYEIDDSEFQTENENSWGIRLKHLTPNKVEHRQLLLLSDGRISASIWFNDQEPILFQSEDDQKFLKWLIRIKKPNSWDRAVELRAKVSAGLVITFIFVAGYFFISPIIDNIFDLARNWYK